jgi:hypothetical protein
MISRAVGFCLMPVDNKTCFIVVTPKDLRDASCAFCLTKEMLKGRENKNT